MGLDMYLFRANQEQLDTLKEIEKLRDELNKKWDKITKEKFPDNWWNLEDNELTDEQKKLLDEMHNDFQPSNDMERKVHDEMNGKTDDEWNGGEIGYWRKFNALHGYIVDEFADGVDECQEIPLSKSAVKQILSVLKDTKEILSHCEKNFDEKYPDYYTYIIGDEELALRPRSGFFFGSDKIDSWFESDVNESIEIFEKVLREWKDDEKVWYEASW